MGFDPAITQDPRFKELSPEEQASILADLEKPQSMMEQASGMVGQAHSAVSGGIETALRAPFRLGQMAGGVEGRPEDAGFLRTAADVVNPLPSSLTDIGQLAGSAAGLLVPGGRTALRAAAGVVGSAAGRAAGAKAEDKDVVFEGLLGGITGLAPVVVSGVMHGAKVGMARATENQVVKKLIDGLNDLLPAGMPKFAQNAAKLESQLSDHETVSIAKAASAKFGDGLKKIEDTPFGNSTIGQQWFTLPSLKKPITFHDMFEIFSGRFNPTKLLSPSAAGTIKPENARQVLMEEFTEAVGNSTNPIAHLVHAQYSNLRNEMNKSMTAVRLLKAGFDSDNGKVDLIKLQKGFKELMMEGDFGGLTAFQGQQSGLRNILGRGQPLTAVDRKLQLPFISGTSQGNLRLGMNSQFALPRAAGVEFQGSNPLAQLLMPQFLAQRAGMATKE